MDKLNLCTFRLRFTNGAFNTDLQLVSYNTLSDIDQLNHISIVADEIIMLDKIYFN